jgi:dipeptidase E
MLRHLHRSTASASLWRLQLNAGTLGRSVCAMKIVLGGGGSAEAEAGVLAHFASLVRGGRILNLPWAQLDPAEPRLHTWTESTLCPLGIRQVTTVSVVNTESSALLGSFDGIFIGGGNTFLLLNRLRDTGMATALVEFTRAGWPCYGGSAGAIVLGAHIGTCAHLDRNEVGLVDLAGINLCDDGAVWCHHHGRDTARITEFVHDTGVEVFSLPENGGLRIGSGTIGSLGDGEVSRWSRSGRARVPAWSTPSP